MEKQDGSKVRESAALSDAWPTAAEITELRGKHYNATLIDRIDVHEDLARFRIRPDNPIPTFQAGQYVALGLGNWEDRLPGTQEETLRSTRYRKVVRRAYSISCPLINLDGSTTSSATDFSGQMEDSAVIPVDTIDYLEFYVTLVRQASSPDHKPPALTPRMFALQPGDRMVVEKKITGHYQLGNMDPHDTVLMLGTGTGEAPHNAMLADLLRRNHQGRIVIATTARKRSDLGYLLEHQLLMSRFPQYRYLPLTTREPENLEKGHPNYVGKQYLQSLFTSGQLAEMSDDSLDPGHTHVFLCGNPSMIGYVPPGADPLDEPGMLPLLKEVGFSEQESSGDDVDVLAGTVRFEKYW